MSKKSMISLGLRLALFVAVVVAMLAAVNVLTRDTIAERKRVAGETARASLMEGCTFTAVPDAEIPEASTVTAVYRAEKDGVFAGYCFDVTVKGYNEITMIVGVGADLSVTGVKILSQTETPGIGSKAVDESGMFLPLFKTLKVEAMQEHFVSGATISSKGIWNGVNDAVNLCSSMLKEKGE